MMVWHMASTFAEKFEQALAEKRKTQDNYGLRTLARHLADNDPHQTEIIRRRLNKYRPPSGGGVAKVAPTPPTRREIEDAMGLERDALAPDPQIEENKQAAAAFLADVGGIYDLWRLGQQIKSGDMELVRKEQVA